MDETHLIVKTDMLDEIKAEFQRQVSAFLLLTSNLNFNLTLLFLNYHDDQLEEFTFKAQIETESGNAKPKQR